MTSVWLCTARLPCSLLNLCTQRNQEHAVKLIVSALDFSRDSLARVILSKVLIAATDVRTSCGQSMAMAPFLIGKAWCDAEDSRPAAVSIGLCLYGMLMLFSLLLPELQAVRHQAPAGSAEGQRRVLQ